MVLASTIYVKRYVDILYVDIPSNPTKPSVMPQVWPDGRKHRYRWVTASGRANRTRQAKRAVSEKARRKRRMT
jgi:hypothetical protein